MSQPTPPNPEMARALAEVCQGAGKLSACILPAHMDLAEALHGMASFMRDRAADVERARMLGFRAPDDPPPPGYQETIAVLRVEILSLQLDLATARERIAELEGTR